MSRTGAAVVAAALSVVLFGAKAVAIGSAGGLGKSAAEGPLFFAGFLTLLAAVVLLAMTLAAGRPVRAQAGIVVGVLVTVAVTVLAVQLLVAAIEPTDPGWAWGEVNLWVVGLGVLVAALVLSRRSRRDLVMSSNPSGGRV